MKLIYYGAEASALRFIDQWGQKNGIEVAHVHEPLSNENIALAKEVDGICTYVNDAMRSDETLYRTLHDYGIKQLSITATGVDGLRWNWARKYGLPVTNVPSYSPTSVAHFAVMSILTMLRAIPLAEKEEANPRAALGRELGDVTVGIVGTGRIGSVVAESICNLGGRVIAYSGRVNPRLSKRIRYVGFEDLLEQSDVISIHVPLTEQTNHLFSESEFAMMKPGSCLVNTARGDIVDTKALLHALADGKVSGAALDTIEDEGQYKATKWTDNPLCRQLMEFPNVVITPHIAYYTERALKEIAQTSLDNARDIILTGQSANLIPWPSNQ